MFLVFSMFSLVFSLFTPVLLSPLFSQFSCPLCSLSSPVLSVLSVLQSSLFSQFSCPLCSLGSPVLSLLSVLPSFLFSQSFLPLSSSILLVLSVLPSSLFSVFSRPLCSPVLPVLLSSQFSRSLSSFVNFNIVCLIHFIPVPFNCRCFLFLQFSNFHSFIFNLFTTSLSGKWTLFEFHVLQKIISLQIENDVNVKPEDLYIAYQQIFCTAYRLSSYTLGSKVSTANH